MKSLYNFSSFKQDRNFSSIWNFSECKIIGVYKSTINILAGGKMFSIVNLEYCPPNSVSINYDNLDFESMLGTTSSISVDSKNKILLLNDISIKVEEGNYSFCSCALAITNNKLKLFIDIVAIFLSEEEHKYDDDNDFLLSESKNRADNLIHKIFFSNNYDDIYKSFNNMIGLGYGLTPSCDDFITGVIFAHYRVKKMIPKKVINNSESIYENKTTYVSVAMLESAFNNHFDERFEYLIDSIFNNDKENMSKYIKLILSIGSSSGYFLLLGFYKYCVNIINT